MKYTIEGFSQEYILTLSYTEVLKNGKEKTVKPEWIDLGLLRYFVDFYPNMKKVEIDGKQYAWLAYSKVLSDLPFLDLNKRSIALHFMKLCNLGLLEQKVFGQGQTVFCFGPKYAGMVDSKHAANISAGDAKFQQLAANISAESADNISAAINLLNNNSNITNIEKEKRNIKESFSSTNSDTLDATIIASDVSPEGDKELTPNPLIRNSLGELVQAISTDIKVQNLIKDYLIVRLEQNPNLTVTQLKASLRSLELVLNTCPMDHPQRELFIEQTIVNATAGAYSQFKEPFSLTRSPYHNDKAKNPFGDTSSCIPAGADLELATDESGNPIKF